MNTFLTSQPIYMQIAERLKKQIIRGRLRPGDKLPSVRELAIQYKVNPNTVQRTYSELEREGVVEMRRGQGTFVTSDKAIVDQLRESLKRQYVEAFVRDMKEMGFSTHEMLSSVEKMCGVKSDD